MSGGGEVRPDVPLEDRVRSAAFIEGCTTSLTINNLPVRLVGVVPAILQDAGMEVEINVALPHNDRTPAAGGDELDGERWKQFPEKAVR